MAWTNTFTGTNNWECIASSADGTKLVAAIYNGDIWTSTNSGLNWTNQNLTNFWRGVTSDDNGVNLAIAVDGGNIFTSIDSGLNWVEQTLSGNKAWRNIASSSDGSKLVAVAYGGNIFTSIDFGVNWTDNGNTGNWQGVCSDSTGTNLAVCSDTGNIWTSANSGATWTIRGTAGTWYDISCSSDGNYLAAVDFGGDIWLSTDAGINWMDASSSYGQMTWRNVFISNDGTKIAAVVFVGDIWLSTNSGTTWVPQNISGSNGWVGITGARNFSTLVAIVNAGGIWTFLADPICLLKGTKILTFLGYKLIENLTTDDTVLTHARGYVKIKYIYSKELNLNIWSEFFRVIRKGSIKKCVPFEDLYLTKHHSLLFKESEDINSLANEKYYKECYDLIYKIKGFNKIHAMHFNKAEKILPTGCKLVCEKVKYYHIVLESENEKEEFSIYANNTLVETCSIENYFSQTK